MAGMSKTSDIDLLLLGKTGNGKSALGNAILGLKHFDALFRLSSVTGNVDFAFSEFKSKTIKVVVGPGLGDTRLDQKEETEFIVKALQEAIAVNPRGYHAFLLVVRYDKRITAEEKGAIKFLKSLFGEKFLNRFGILVFTFGDLFESQNAGKTIDQWCREQDGEFKEVLDEFDHRVVLFDNATENKKKQEAQIDKLLEIVKNLPNEGHRYTDANFELARAAREKGILELKKHVEQQDVTKEISIFRQNLEDIKKPEKSKKQVQFLTDLLARLNELALSYRNLDDGTGDLEDIEKCLNFVTMSINESLHVPQSGAQNTREKEDKEEDIISQLCHALRKQSDQINIMIAQQKESQEGRKKLEKELDDLKRKMRYEKEQTSCAVL